MPLIRKRTKCQYRASPTLQRIESYVFKRFDAKYLADFKRAFKQNPEKALELLRKWEDF